LPEIPEESRWYIVKSRKPVRGKDIKINNYENDCLNLTAVLAYGEDYDDDGLEERERKAEL